MKEIKFRAKTLDGELIYFDLHESQLSADGKVFYVDGVPCEVGTEQEYTSRQDKNGVEIYEGDVVNFHTSYEYGDDDYSGTTVVRWIDIEAGFWPFTLNNRWRCDVEDVKVIGNIYENPELVNNG